MCKELPDGDPDRQAICKFLMETLSAENRAQAIMDSIRFCRIRNTYDRGTAMWEIGFTPLSTPEVKAWYLAFRRLMVSKMGAEEKTGIAPKTAIERRLEKCLRDLGIWK